MYTNPRPGFITSKGERGTDETFYDPFDKYRQLAKGLYIWDGLPDDVPEGFIEECLFDYGAVSAKFVSGMGIVISPAMAKSWNHYGRIKEWVPTAQIAYPTSDITKINEPSNNPVLQLDLPTRLAIEYDVNILWDAKISLAQNVLGMRQPIVFMGTTGNVQDVVLLDKEINVGKRAIPVVDPTKVKAEILDLKVTDFTPSLMQVEQDQDAKILTRMGINNRGVEKESGINLEESTAHKQGLRLSSSLELIKRQVWADAITRALNADDRLIEKVNISVMINPEYDEPEEQPTDSQLTDGDNSEQ